jgi:hypothetical protein
MRDYFKLPLVFVSAVLLATCTKEEENKATPTPKPTLGCFDQDTTYTTQLPNMDFEDWGYHDSSGGKYQDPCGGAWTSSNALSYSITTSVNILQSSDGRGGSKAARIETKSLIGPIVSPGILFTGRYKSYNFSGFDISANTEFGVPFTQKPTDLEGFCKYSPAVVDTGLAFVLLTRYNNTSHSRDTVGFGQKLFTGLSTSYTYFTVPLSYAYSAGASQPDTILLFFSASKGALELAGSAGSTLFVDDLSFKY